MRVNWARIARTLFELSMGRITPLDVERMTIDQLLVIWLKDLNRTTITEGEAVAEGLMEPGGKTGTEMALERAQAKAAASQGRRQSLRERKRRRRQSESS